MDEHEDCNRELVIADNRITELERQNTDLQARNTELVEANRQLRETAEALDIMIYCLGEDEE